MECYNQVELASVYVLCNYGHLPLATLVEQSRRNFLDQHHLAGQVSQEIVSFPLRLPTKLFMFVHCVEIIDWAEVIGVFFEINFKPLQITTPWVINTGMDPRSSVWLTLLESLDTLTLDNSGLEQIDALFFHIKFYQASMTSFGVLDSIEFRAMKPIDVTNVS